MEPRLNQAKAGLRAVFFVDAAHFVWRAFLGFLWCFTRVFIQAPAGRRRFNVLSAVNAITHEMTNVCNETYITATTVCELLDRLADLQLSIPITLIMDNARYQYCRLVIDHAKKLNIELLFLPSYSPNLNLIERLWKWIKKRCLYNKYYSDFDQFKQAILDQITEPDLKYKSELDSLLSLKFQTLPNPQSMAA